MFGTGHTFADNDLLTEGLSRGPRRIFYVQPPSYSKIVQIEGRTKRRCLHAGYGSDVNIERFILVPTAIVKGSEQNTCYNLFSESTAQEKYFMDSISPACLKAHTREGVLVH